MKKLLFSSSAVFILFLFSPTPANACTTNLSLGSEGSGVTCLQQMLTLTGDYTYGSPTGYFGPVTQAAIQKFQARMNIVNSGTPQTTGYGNAGPTTRRAIIIEVIKLLQARIALLTGTTPATPGGGGTSGGGSSGSSGGGGGGNNPSNPTNPTPTEPPPSNPEPISLPPKPIPSLLVGYWGSAFSYKTGEDYITEVAPVSNIVFVKSATTEETVRKIGKAADENLLVMLGLENVLFSETSLYPDWQNRFDDLWQEIGDLQGEVISFYVFDEPYGKNTGFLNQGKGVPHVELRQSLDDVIAYLDEKAPGRLMATTFTPLAEVRNSQFASLFLPPGIDIFGVNCYMSGSANCTEAGIQQLIDIMLAAKSPAQKLVVTMDSFWPKKPTTSDEAKLVGQLAVWQRIIENNRTHIKAVLPFIYQTVNANINGAEDMPLVEEAYAQYLKSLLGRLDSTTATISATPNPCTTSNPTCTINLTWQGDAGIAPLSQVWVIRNNNTPQLFGCNLTGNHNIAWILPGSVYEFLLYPATSCEADGILNTKTRSVYVGGIAQ